MKYKIKKDVLWKKVDDEIVIVNTKTDDYSYLNHTGSAVWKTIEKGYTYDKMIKELSDEFDESELKIKKDVKKLINDLLSAGIIESVEK